MKNICLIGGFLFLYLLDDPGTLWGRLEMFPFVFPCVLLIAYGMSSKPKASMSAHEYCRIAEMQEEIRNLKRNQA